MSSRAAESEQGTAEMGDVGERERARDSSILSLLLREPGYPWSRDELARAFRDDLYTIDAVARLEEAGLLHRIGEFVFPTLACRRADELDFG